MADATGLETDEAFWTTTAVSASNTRQPPAAPAPPAPAGFEQGNGGIGRSTSTPTKRVPGRVTTPSLKHPENKAVALTADLEPGASREHLVGALPTIRCLRPH